MSCCLDSPVISLNHGDQTSPSASPRLSISLDLPAYEGYLPTYWPGQSINGKLQIQLNSPVKVSCLRVALYGNVQVCGSQREVPLYNGLFDYHKNVQLINKGIRIMKRPGHDNVISSESHHLEVVAEEHHGTFNEDESDHSHERRHCVAPEKKRKKSEQDKQIERLIRRIADDDFDKDSSHGTFVDDSHLYDHNNERTYSLDGKKSNVRFSIGVPMSQKLGGTFDHPNYPITYRIIAIMKCATDDSQQHLTCYSTAKVRLEPYLDIHAPEFRSPLQSAQARLYLSGNNNIFKNICSCLLPNSLLIKPTSSTSNSHQTTFFSNSSHLLGRLEIPVQAFERSDAIPLKLKLINMCPSFKIYALKVKAQLTQRILMTCSFGEAAEYKTIMEKQILFNSNEHSILGSNGTLATLDTPKLSFDLSKLIHIPPSCVCSIPSKSTREIFSLVHDINVKLEIDGALLKKLKNDTISYEGLTQSENGGSVRRYQSIRKVYEMEIEPLPIIIGNSGYEIKQIM
ncbi:hypothetical protein RMCBS344292_18901 [Rhizopus microsporus]|nr:hypothetical protein RMCBS344292_18901 [Rhizopus microsporus]